MSARTPEEVDTLFERAINRGDAEAVALLYEDDAVFVPLPGQAVQGREAIREQLKTVIAMGASLKLKVVRAHVAGDTAVLYNDWTGTARTADGNDMVLAGKAIEIVRKQPDGTWLFAIDDPYGRG
jgi:uncharacterized protein (TIGR02246 family)